MRILTYRGLDSAAIPGLDKLTARLAADDFRSADVKKVGDNLYRARLDRSNRLLFALYRHNGERCALLLEYISQHAYEKSRFLARGVAIDEDRIPEAAPEAADEAPELPYLNPSLPRFHLLDKVLSFDEDQELVYRQPPPLVIIGSAGSGKTALTLEKMKDGVGDILYVTRSAFLVQNARDLYYANGWQSDDQTVDFLSFREYLESIHVPEGKEITPRAFAGWAARQRLPKALKDSHQLFEEFQGAITGTDPEQAYLSREDYLALGVRQSIFAPEDRGDVYDLFEKYLRFLDEQGWFDPNLISHAWLQRVEENDGLLPDNIGQSGQIGEYRDGQWWGGLYGWHGRYGLMMMFASLSAASECAYMLSGDPKYLDLPRSQLQGLMDRSRITEDGQLLVPFRHGKDGWFSYRPMMVRDLAHV